MVVTVCATIPDETVYDFNAPLNLYTFLPLDGTQSTNLATGNI